MNSKRWTTKKVMLDKGLRVSDLRKKLPPYLPEPAVKLVRRCLKMAKITGFAKGHHTVAEMEAAEYGLELIDSGAYSLVFAMPGSANEVIRVSFSVTDGHRDYVEWMSKQKQERRWMPKISHYIVANNVHLSIMERLEEYGAVTDYTHHLLQVKCPPTCHTDLWAGNVMRRKVGKHYVGVVTDPWCGAKDRHIDRKRDSTERSLDVHSH